MSEPAPYVAWQNGQLLPANELRVGVDDTGFRQGVVAVERLRTYDGSVASLESHVVRWRRTIEELYLTMIVDTEEIQQRIASLLEANRDWIDHVGDCGVVMLATPGSPSSKQPNEMMHLLSLDHKKIERHRTSGQPLFITDVEQPSRKCWPRDIKVRCRLHYYLANQQARDHHCDAVGLLIDHNGTVTETSVANIAIVKNDQVKSPPSEQVLPGITQQVVQQVCENIGLPWIFEELWPAEIREADEVWLMGTDGGLWFANRVDGAKIMNEAPGPRYTQCLAEFYKLVRDH